MQRWQTAQPLKNVAILVNTEDCIIVIGILHVQSTMTHIKVTLVGIVRIMFALNGKNGKTLRGCILTESVKPMLEIRPITLRDANRYVAENHRHNLPTNGHKFSIACYDDDRLCGVAIAGQPIARKLDDGLTIEIRRVCTDGTRNACSILYGACSRCAKEMGYKRVITYTLKSEPGTSLKASGFINKGEAGGVSWNQPSRHREVTQVSLFGEERKYPDEKKIRWEKNYK